MNKPSGQALGNRVPVANLLPYLGRSWRPQRGPHGTYLLRRYAAGTSPVRQDRRSPAPARRGHWAFFCGTERRAGNVPPAPHRKWHTLATRPEAPVYCGWSTTGHLTMDGFFNVGTWRMTTVGEAAESLLELLSADWDPRDARLAADSLQIFLPVLSQRPRVRR